MIYRLLKVPARLALWIFCRHIQVNDKSFLKSEGPLLIASNHPNSFLDAIILSCLFKQPVHSLARGDVFKSKFNNAFLRSINMLPVFRSSEGAENMEQNYTSFDSCREIFKKGGIVLIFIEGRCINEWHLRPFMKGAARLALSSWDEGIPLKILPAGLNYQSFTSFGKNLQLNFGKIIEKKDINLNEGYGRSISAFNTILQKALQPLVYEINKNDSVLIRKKFRINLPFLKKLFLSVPAGIGYLFHWPLYFFVQKYAWKKASHNDHYDSILVGLLFGLYPLYLILITLVFTVFSGSRWMFLILVIAPLCARSFVQLKKQF